MLRNGEQLLLAVVIPLLVLVGGVLAVDRRRPGPRRPARRRADPRRARAGRDVDGVHLARDRHRLRAPVRRASSGSAPPRSPGTGCCSARCWRLLVVEVLQVVVIVRGRPGARLGARHAGVVPAPPSRCCSAPPRSRRSACFVAGVLRAEATLAAANLVYLLLMAGGAVVLPAASYGALRRRRRWLPSGALGEALRAALLDGALDGPRPARAARLGRRRHRPDRHDVLVGVTCQR